ncbi:MAG: GNAT family N-acetyltransferase [Hyphomicrobiaceae bacterium]|nr:GNAT family N-acetyltransferase [Hyphomicrobiaceae bacterium]
MVFLRMPLANEPEPQLRGGGLHMRPPALADYSQWAELRAQSRDFLTPWEPEWAADELTRTAFRRRVRYYQRDLREDGGYAFFLFRDGDGRLLGGLTLGNVRRGVTQAASLGYWVGAPHARQGHMTRAVGLLVPFAFRTLRLHRLEAACLPHNVASIRVLERSGFQREGTARRYLRINGVWQDHDIFARLEDDPVAGGE